MIITSMQESYLQKTFYPATQLMQWCGLPCGGFGDHSCQGCYWFFCWHRCSQRRSSILRAIWSIWLKLQCMRTLCLTGQPPYQLTASSLAFPPLACVFFFFCLFFLQTEKNKLKYQVEHLRHNVFTMVLLLVFQQCQPQRRTSSEARRWTKYKGKKK